MVFGVCRGEKGGRSKNAIEFVLCGSKGNQRCFVGLVRHETQLLQDVRSNEGRCFGFDSGDEQEWSEVGMSGIGNGSMRGEIRRRRVCAVKVEKESSGDGRKRCAQIVSSTCFD